MTLSLITCASTQSIYQLIEAQVDQCPHATAVLFADQSLTYQTLNSRANQLAYYLKSLGIGPGSLVGLGIERSLDLMVGLLGILKAGAAYVPLDPAYPSERLAYMVADAGLTVIVTQQTLKSQFLASGAHQICIDTDWQAIAQQPNHNPKVAVSDSDLAYIIYTSGSTGKPKGVQIHHRGLSNVLQSMALEPGLSAKDVVLAVTTISFDIAVLELFLPLIVGATVVVIPRDIAIDGIQLAQHLAKYKTTMMQATPATWRLLLASGWQGQVGLKILCGGEALTRDLANALLERCDLLWNMYGPTETTIWSMVYRVEPGDGPVSIGYPIANTDLRVIQNDSVKTLKLASPGEIGELYIGGAGVANGYLNRPELTEKRFIADPFSDRLGARLYKTGDLVCQRPDGTLQFIGRADHQVKIRGFRVELEEVEAAILSHPDIHAAATAAQPDNSGELQLVGYLVPKTKFTPESKLSTPDDNPSAQNAQDEKIAGWQSVWDAAYIGLRAETQDPTFDFSGYGDSYTGQIIAEDLVREWVSHTVDRILALKPRRALEMGCGKGLLLFRVAPRCDRYVGVDVSSSAIEHLQAQFEHSPASWEHVSLYRAAAHELEQLDELQGETFDTIIINGVIQYFPNAAYLVEAMKILTKFLSPGGRIFVGDVRHPDLLSIFHTSVQLQRLPLGSTTNDLLKVIQNRAVNDRELLVHHDFFKTLHQHCPGLVQVTNQLKRGECRRNELVNFRYDVVLRFDALRPDASYDNQSDSPERSPVLSIESIPFDSSGIDSLTSIIDYLQTRQPQVLELVNIPNARIKEASFYWQTIQSEPSNHPGRNPDLLDANSDQTLAQLTQTLAPNSGIDPEDLWKLTETLPYHIQICWSQSPNPRGTYDARFQRLSEPSIQCLDSTEVDRIQANWAAYPWPLASFASSATIPPWAELVREPKSLGPTDSPVILSQQAIALIQQLRQYLASKVPSYMIPTQFVALQTLPLTPNGKVDRQALSQIKLSNQRTSTNHTSPLTLVEKQLTQIWERVLRLEGIGVHDHFFDLGGHSLLVAQLFGEIERHFQCRLPLTAIFQSPTISQLAKQIEMASPLSLQVTRNPAIVQFKDGKLRPALFLMIAFDEDTELYINLARHMDDDRAIYGIQPYDTEGQFIPFTRIPEIASYLIQQMQAVQPEGPYLLGGQCGAGIVAFEMAQQLKRQGQVVEVLILIEAVTADIKKIGLRGVLQALKYSAKKLQKVLLSTFLEPYLDKQLFLHKSLLELVSKYSDAWALQYRRDRNLSLGTISGRTNSYRIFDFAELQYRSKNSRSQEHFHGNFVLLRASERTGLPYDEPYIYVYGDPLLGWGDRVRGSLRVYDVPGGHGSMLFEPHAKASAEVVQQEIQWVLGNQSKMD